ncbi:MAG: hypothetical protein A2508_01795 [Candidatus Lambdaproteobacteria bacterium RIFOXYD12_FULL_49_8]|uniref:Pentapeptide repeat protein n=1 Tax=Candidatus Lambdaproteobacteria bacterium RIFOXYD2_FULL_50_16 TaxID=1817772 RepID=A0A1F6GFC8_9PROT|nr:MAG: hypothetical protein A2527_00730 [Candidatus Lambdaproteobacteria bacterium RIFOXYD2_FULL_50_16]OGG98206.1 MAG: hypothetical protein A2508_01795 [Candidatus Lambdaproteobacteria bacterium RIFOXYD12_FULL_49_8]
MKRTLFFLTLLSLMLVGSLLAYTAEEQVRHLNHCTGCYLARTNFAHHDLTGVDLSGANLEYASFLGATLTDAKFGGANLKGANFTGALWVDGKTVCKKGSIGKCLAQEAPAQ